MSDFVSLYRDALDAFLARGGEVFLKQAYELGHQALVDGKGILDVLAVHQQALRAAAPDPLPLLDRHHAGDFLAECLSPFEMTHRAYGDSIRTLRRLNEALEQESRRIAAALHDESGQLLAAVHIQLQDLGRDLRPAQRARLVAVGAQIEQIEQQLRLFARELRPAVLDDFGLLPALRAFAATFSRRTGLQVVFDGEMHSRLPPAVEVAMYRVGQEALNNVARHARASHIFIRLWRRPGAFHCCIGDDGVGLPPAPARPHRGLGLVGMRERIASVGGALQFVSAPDQGTELRIVIPVED